MTDISDAEVHRAAAALHQALTTDPAPEDADRFLSRSKDWHEVVQDPTDLRNRVRDLVVGAADVSEWAVELGATGLKPYHSHAWKSPDGFELAVQVAASARLNPAKRRELIRAVHTAIEDTYRRFFGQVPVRDQASPQ